MRKIIYLFSNGSQPSSKMNIHCSQTPFLSHEYYRARKTTSFLRRQHRPSISCEIITRKIVSSTTKNYYFIDHLDDEQTFERIFSAIIDSFIEATNQF